MSKKKKKNILNSWFYRIYFAVILLALIAIAIGAGWLNGVLKDYESAQPVYVAQEAAELFENTDFDEIYELDTSAEEISGGDKSFYVDSMHAIADGKAVEWSEAFSPNDDERRYSVTLDGSKFATFTLVPSGETTERGNRLWELDSVTTHVVLSEEEEQQAPRVICHITAPTESTVTVDGRTLGEDDVVKTGIAAMLEGFLPDGLTVPTLTEYTFIPEGDAPSIAVTDKDGNAQTVAQESEYVWYCGLPENRELKEKFSDSVFAVAKQLALFTSKDITQKKMLSYTATDSPAYKTIKNYSNRYGTPHKSVDFQNVNISEFYLHSDTCFSCKISFDFILHTRKSGDKVTAITYTFCFVREGGGGKLYNLILG